jgi:hypothetical protein
MYDRQLTQHHWSDVLQSMRLKNDAQVLPAGQGARTWQMHNVSAIRRCTQCLQAC